MPRYNIYPSHQEWTDRQRGFDYSTDCTSIHIAVVQLFFKLVVTSSIMTAHQPFLFSLRAFYIFARLGPTRARTILFWLRCTLVVNVILQEALSRVVGIQGMANSMPVRSPLSKSLIIFNKLTIGTKQLIFDPFSAPETPLLTSKLSLLVRGTQPCSLLASSFGCVAPRR